MAGIPHTSGTAAHSEGSPAHAAPASPFAEVQPLHRNPLVRVLMPVSMITVTGILLAVAAASPPASRATVYWTLAGCVGLECAIVFGMRQVVTIQGGVLTAAFTPLFPWTRRIRLDRLASARRVRVQPLAEFGGYGVRSSRKHGRVFIVAGEHAVAMVEDSGRKTLVGTRDPERLLDALRAHHRMHAPGRELAEMPDPDRSASV